LGRGGQGIGREVFWGGRGARAWEEGDVLLSRGSSRAGRRSLRSSAGVHLAWPAWLQRGANWDRCGGLLFRASIASSTSKRTKLLWRRVLSTL
jgi:hypothetical protein